MTEHLFGLLASAIYICVPRCKLMVCFWFGFLLREPTWYCQCRYDVFSCLKSVSVLGRRKESLKFIFMVNLRLLKGFFDGFLIPSLRSSTPSNSRLCDRSQYTTPSSSQGGTQKSSTPIQKERYSRTYTSLYIFPIICIRMSAIIENMSPVEYRTKYK